MKDLGEKLTVWGIVAIVAGIAVHVLSDMFFTSNKAGMAILIIGFCIFAAGGMIKETQK